MCGVEFQLKRCMANSLVLNSSLIFMESERDYTGPWERYDEYDMNVCMNIYCVLCIFKYIFILNLFHLKQSQQNLLLIFCQYSPPDAPWALDKMSFTLHSASLFVCNLGKERKKTEKIILNVIRPFVDIRTGHMAKCCSKGN